MKPAMLRTTVTDSTWNAVARGFVDRRRCLLPVRNRLWCHRRRWIVRHRCRLLLLLLGRGRYGRAAGCCWRWRAREGLGGSSTLRSRMEMCSHCSLLQLLNHRTHRIAVLCRIGFGRRRCVPNVQLMGRHDILQVPQELSGIFLSPQVNVDRVYSEEILLLVSFVVGVEVPLSLTRDCCCVQHDCEKSWLLVRVLQASDRVQVAKESILIRRAGMIGDLELCTVLFRVVVYVRIASS